MASGVSSPESKGGLSGVLSNLKECIFNLLAQLCSSLGTSPVGV